jgi:hypothetical protein
MDETDTKVGAWTDTQTATQTVVSHGEPPAYVKDLDYTAEEEKEVVRILDTRLFPFILLTTFVLNMDRTNHSNAISGWFLLTYLQVHYIKRAISDNLPADLGFNITTVNTGTAIYSVAFSIFCL